MEHPDKVILAFSFGPEIIWWTCCWQTLRNYPIFALPPVLAAKFIENRPGFDGRPTSVVVTLTIERSVVFPLSGTLFGLYGYNVGSRSGEHTCAVLAQGELHKKSTINISDFHCLAGHAHEVLPQ